MMPDVDVWALTDTALWERITWCARSQGMWAPNGGRQQR